MVAKRNTSPYQPGRRSRFWLKTPIRSTARLVVGGWIPAGARPDAIGSLLVGGHDQHSCALRCCGHITSGFSDRTRAPSTSCSPTSVALTRLSPTSPRQTPIPVCAGSTRCSSAASNTASSPGACVMRPGKGSRPPPTPPRTCRPVLTIKRRATITGMSHAAAPTPDYALTARQFARPARLSPNWSHCSSRRRALPPGRSTHATTSRWRQRHTGSLRAAEPRCWPTG